MALSKSTWLRCFSTRYSLDSQKNKIKNMTQYFSEIGNGSCYELAWIFTQIIKRNRWFKWSRWHKWLSYSVINTGEVSWKYYNRICFAILIFQGKSFNPVCRVSEILTVSLRRNTRIGCFILGLSSHWIYTQFCSHLGRKYGLYVRAVGPTVPIAMHLGKGSLDSAHSFSLQCSYRETTVWCNKTPLSVMFL